LHKSRCIQLFCSEFFNGRFLLFCNIQDTKLFHTVQFLQVWIDDSLKTSIFKNF
jgi:hypothetical protein